MLAHATSAAEFRKTKALHLVQLFVVAVAAVTAAGVILKRKPAPIKSQQTAVQAAEKDKCCLSGVHLVAVIAWKASSFVPDG